MMARWFSLICVLGILASLLSSPARAIPAFARKTGLRCTSCHVSWPVLSDFGRAFRDNGYQMRLGKDDPTTTTQGYWPVAIRTTPHYEYDTINHQDTDQGMATLRSGGIADGAMDLLTAGTVAPNASFLVVPTGFASDGAVNLESYWVYLSRFLFKSDWFNLRIGKHEVDLPASAHRSINLTNGYLVYGYHAGGDADAAGAFDISENQRGVEIVGHDQGSFARYTVSVFDANDSPGSANGWDSPGVYGHVQKYWQRNSNGLSEFEIGAFGARASYPTTFLTSGGDPIAGTGSDLKNSTRVGGEAMAWLGPPAAPLYLTAVFASGSDEKALYAGAARNGTWNGGFLEAVWVPAVDMLHWGVFGRYDMIRNQDQPFDGVAKDFNDQDQVTLGIKYTLNYNNRAEYALHAEYQMNTAKGVASDGSDVTASTTFVGIDFAY